ncbi:MAG: hypothetical protein ACREL9_03400, partial [Gemmatimonadales bacterium]
MSRRSVTIVVHVDGELTTRRYRLPVWALEAGKWGALGIAILVVLFFAFAGPISRKAAEYPLLKREIARLEQDNARVQQLAAALNRAEANYQELRQMLGAKAPPAGAPAARGSTAAGNVQLMRAVPVRAGGPGGGV